jgi:hypothetical protein
MTGHSHIDSLPEYDPEAPQRKLLFVDLDM